MMRLELTVLTRSGLRRDIVVTASPSTSLREVLAQYLGTPASAVFLGDTALNLDATLSSGVLHSGDRVAVGRPDPRPGWPLVGTSLGVAGGAAAGTILTVPNGRLVIGRDARADLTIADQTVSARHATAELQRDGSLMVTDAGSANGTFLDGRRLAVGVPVNVLLGQRVVFGQAVCELLARTDPDGAVEDGEDGQRLFNRVVKYRSARPERRITLPADPVASSNRTSNVAQYVGTVAMLVAGIGASLVYGKPLLALLGVVGPLALVAATAMTQRSNQSQQTRQRKEFVAARSKAVAEIADAVLEEDNHEWRSSVDPVTSVLAAVGPTSALWSADAAAPGALTVRLGTHDRTTRVEIQSSGNETITLPTLVATPVTLDLRTSPVLGIAGDVERSGAFARALVHQIVTTRSPEDLVVFHLSAEAGDDSWSWLRWLPHVRGLDEEVHTVAPGPEALKARLGELISLMEQRSTLSQYGYAQQVLLPEVVVILDGAGALRSRGNVVRVLTDGPAIGLRIIAIDRLAARLPAEATARFVIDPEGTGAQLATLEVRDRPTVTSITPDLLAGDIAERSSRALAALHPLGGGDSSAIPDSVRFADVVGLDRIRETDVRQRWAAGEEGQAVLGVDEHGNVAVVDLVRDGPHALVAGTSGSGKSELLRTLLAGLALSSDPENLSMLLIDFKGGGAFGKLEKLPHVVGYADDLMIGGRLADRLLESLRAELEYRKRYFKDAGNVEGLVEYRDSRRRDPELPLIARLVLVVDEFAELKEAQPDFVDGLVNIARVGRSLGVHLILATQQPAGVVTPQIRDNANLRICLRVLDPSTSLDLVGTPVAATFSNRAKGRAVVLSGDSPALVLQTAYVTAPVRRPHLNVPAPPSVLELPWPGCGIRRSAQTRAEANDDPETDLSELVTLLSQTAIAAGTNPARRPWHQPLPQRILLSDLTSVPLPFGIAPFSVEDRPSQQRQPAGTLTLGGGNIGLAGGRASGRSTALRTLAVSLANRHSVDDLHLYVIDHTPTAVLRPLLQLPHCGVVATRNERHKTERLAVRLSELMNERASLLAGAEASTFTELRASDPGAPPHVVLLIDGWDSIAQAGDALHSTLLRVAEDGPTLGIQMVVSGGKAVADPKLLRYLADLLCLPFEQRDDMLGFGVPVRSIPENLPPGRAYRPGSPDAIQIALLTADPAPEAQNEALRAAANSCADGRRHSPFHLDDLPARITIAEAANLPAVGPQTGLSVIAGVGGDELTARRLDLRRANPFLVIGPPGSGRTTALACLTAQLVAAGTKVYVVPADEEDGALFDGAELLGVRPDGDAPAGAVIVIDDAGHLPDGDEFIRSALADSASTVILSGEAAALTAFGGWRPALRSASTGLLLSPKYGDGDAIAASIGMAQAFSASPGRAYLSVRGRLELVQVPTGS
ncbi:MAG: FtsK/SpoIIIE domain-containing protein [Mycobacteriaceae bacterium]